MRPARTPSKGHSPSQESATTVEVGHMVPLHTLNTGKFEYLFMYRGETTYARVVLAKLLNEKEHHTHVKESTYGTSRG